jgi:hypothetical protein
MRKFYLRKKLFKVLNFFEEINKNWNKNETLFYFRYFSGFYTKLNV